jgi:hypothetical protein
MTQLRSDRNHSEVRRATEMICLEDGSANPIQPHSETTKTCIKDCIGTISPTSSDKFRHDALALQDRPFPMRKYEPLSDGLVSINPDPIKSWPTASSTFFLQDGVGFESEETTLYSRLFKNIAKGQCQPGKTNLATIFASSVARQDAAHPRIGLAACSEAKPATPKEPPPLQRGRSLATIANADCRPTGSPGL